MVQGEKQSMASLSSSNRTSDPAARKAGFEAVKKMEMNKSLASSSNSNSWKSGQQQGNQQYGSWGPTFKNQSNFKEMHWC